MLIHQIRTLNIRKLSNFISGSKAIHWVVEFSAFFRTINLWSRHISLTVWFAHLKAGQPSHLKPDMLLDHLVSSDVLPDYGEN